MLIMKKVWPIVIQAILLGSHFGVHGDIARDPKDPWRGLAVSCTPEDPNNSSISCHGVRIVRKIIQQLLDNAGSSIKISEGISLVNSDDAGAAARRARNVQAAGNVGSILGFLEGKELRVKLPSLVPANLQNAIIDSLPKGRGHGGGGFGGGKKGDNSLMMMGLMMGKMVAAIGFGSLGMLAMKALMVSSLALMLSLIVAAKKFTGGQDSGSGHHVVYAQETGHHQSKRSANFEDIKFSPYSGYARIHAVPRSS